MSIFSSNTNSSLMFPKSKKIVKLYNNSIVAIDGPNILSNLSLCDIKIEYDNYDRLRTRIPAGSTNFVLTHPLIGLKPIFIVIKPDYCDCDEAKKYLFWKYLHSSEPFNAMTSILMLSGTSTNPIPQIVLSNPDTNKDVYLDIFVVSTDTDVFTDSEQYYYIQDLVYEDFITIGPGVLGIFRNGELLLSVDFADINNILKPKANRIVIDDSTQTDIILDFTNESDSNQIISVINYILNNPGIELPLPKDITAPIITYTPLVINNTADIEFINNLTKADLITLLIDNCIDDRDGLITINPLHISLFNGTEVNLITGEGIYTFNIKVSDLAGNETNETITLNVVDNIIMLADYDNSILTDDDDIIIL